MKEINFSNNNCDFIDSTLYNCALAQSLDLFGSKKNQN